MGAVLHRGVHSPGTNAMARNHIARGDSGRVGDPTAVERYLSDLETHLQGPRRARAAILAESRDGLHQAIDSQLARGHRRTAATKLAIAEFGAPVTVAEAFAGELAIGQARHTIRALLFTGPLVGVCWLFLLVHRWPVDPRELWTAIPILPIIGLAVATGAIILISTGSLGRYLPEPTPARALSAAASIGAVCLAADVIVLMILAAQIAHGQHLTAPLAVLAAGLSLIRLGVAGHLTTRCLHVKRSLAGPRSGR